MNMKNKIYIIHSEYVQNGITFNSRNRYVLDRDKAFKIYQEVLKQMKDDNNDMLSDKDDYVVNHYGQKNYKCFSCYYKYQPGLSNFSVDILAEELE